MTTLASDHLKAMATATVGRHPARQQTPYVRDPCRVDFREFAPLGPRHSHVMGTTKAWIGIVGIDPQFPLQLYYGNAVSLTRRLIC